jgi:hypothetical protein
VRAWLAGERERRERAASVLEPYRAYIESRLGDDPHLDATVLLRELRPLGFERSFGPQWVRNASPQPDASVETLSHAPLQGF